MWGAVSHLGRLQTRRPHSAPPAGPLPGLASSGSGAGEANTRAEEGAQTSSVLAPAASRDLPSPMAHGRLPALCCRPGSRFLNTFPFVSKSMYMVKALSPPVPSFSPRLPTARGGERTKAHTRRRAPRRQP